MAEPLSGSVNLKRIHEFLTKTLSPSDLSNYHMAIDSAADTDTKEISLAALSAILGSDIITGLYNDRGIYDASTNLFPATGGSGTGGAILQANVWTISVAGTLGGVAVVVNQTIRALTDSPGQTATNWLISANVSTYRPITEPAMSASALELDCENNDSAMFEPSPYPITSGFTLSFINITNTNMISMVLSLTGTVTITMPSDVDVSIPSSIGDWSGKPDLEIAAGTADVIEFQFLRYKQNSKWLLKVSEVAE